MTQRESDAVDIVLGFAQMEITEFEEMSIPEFTLEELCYAALCLEGGGFLIINRLESATEYRLRLTEAGMEYWIDDAPGRFRTSQSVRICNFLNH